MTRSKLIERILGFGPDDWFKISCSSTDGPSYRFDVSEVGGEPRIRKHNLVAVLKSDISVTMAWGFDTGTQIEEDWTRMFHHPPAHACLIDVFYNGALVFRSPYASVDDGRVNLPIPKPKLDDQGKVVAWEVPERYYRFIGILDVLDHGDASPYDEFFKGPPGFSLVRRSWPKE